MTEMENPSPSGPDLSRIPKGLNIPPPIAALLGLELVALEDGRAVFQMQAGVMHTNPMGTMHGGVLCDLADAAMGMAFASTLSQGESFTTLELKINFMRSVKEARLTAEGRLIRRGRTIGLASCEVRDSDDNLVAFATSTCMVMR